MLPSASPSTAFLLRDTVTLLSFTRGDRVVALLQCHGLRYTNLIGIAQAFLSTELAACNAQVLHVCCCFCWCYQWVTTPVAFKHSTTAYIKTKPRTSREKANHQGARQGVHHRVAESRHFGRRGTSQDLCGQSNGWASYTYLYLCFVPEGCVSQMGERIRCIWAPLPWSRAIRTGRTKAKTEERVDVAVVQEMPQNGKGAHGGLPGNMQHNQQQVVPTSALEGCSATAFTRPLQWESKREVCVKEKEAGGREGWREGGRGPRATARVRANWSSYSCSLDLQIPAPDFSGKT